MATTRTSSQFWLNARDFAKALAVAALTAPITTILTSIQAGSFTIDWIAIWHMAAGAAAAYLLKNFLTPAQTVSTPPKIILILLCIGMTTSGQAQSFFKPLPKQSTAMRFMQVYGDSVIASPAAPTMTSFRPVLNAVTYSEPDHVAMAGVGVSYQWLKYNATTQKWETTFAINGLFYGGAGLASPNQGIYAAGPSISLLNGFLSIGGAYNFTTKKFGPTLGINVQLNN